MRLFEQKKGFFIMYPSHKDAIDCLKLIASKKIKETPFEDITPYVLKIKMMLENGEDVNMQTKSGKTLLHAVLSSKMVAYNNWAKKIYENDPKKSADFEPLDVKYLTTKFRPNPFVRDDKGMTPSMKALEKGLKNEFRWLLSYENAYQAEKHSQALEALAILAQLVPSSTEDKDPYRKTVIVKAQRKFLNAMHDLSDSGNIKED